VRGLLRIYRPVRGLLREKIHKFSGLQQLRFYY
jgi:hypothetical protein